MQEIFILRHAHAEDDSADDFSRKLTDEGKTKTKKLGRFFNKLEEQVDIILSSPVLRAKETAEIFIKNLDKKPELKIVDFLSCGASTNSIKAGIKSFLSFDKIMLVGHAPDLEIFLGLLIGVKKVPLKKCALAKVKLNNSFDLSGELEYLITPKLLKEL